MGVQSPSSMPSLGIYRRQPLVARGGQCGGEGIDPVVLADIAGREHSHPCGELGRHVHHRLACRRQPHCQVCRPRPPAFSTAQRRSGNRFAQRSSDLKPVRSTCPYSPKCVEKLSEKGCRRRSERRFGRNTGAKMGRIAPLGRPERPRFGHLRYFSDSLLKLSEKPHERANRVAIRRLIAT
jgi:hypothetical protein